MYHPTRFNAAVNQKVTGNRRYNRDNGRPTDRERAAQSGSSIVVCPADDDSVLAEAMVRATSNGKRGERAENDFVRIWRTTESAG
jgi:hypothetical protein